MDKYENYGLDVLDELMDLFKDNIDILARLQVVRFYMVFKRKPSRIEIIDILVHHFEMHKKIKHEISRETIEEAKAIVDFRPSYILTKVDIDNCSFIRLIGKNIFLNMFLRTYPYPLLYNLPTIKWNKDLLNSVLISRFRINICKESIRKKVVNCLIPVIEISPSNLKIEESIISHYRTHIEKKLIEYKKDSKPIYSFVYLSNYSDNSNKNGNGKYNEYRDSYFLYNISSTNNEYLNRPYYTRLSTKNTMLSTDTLFKNIPVNAVIFSPLCNIAGTNHILTHEILRYWEENGRVSASLHFIPKLFFITYHEATHCTEYITLDYTKPNIEFTNTFFCIFYFNTCLLIEYIKMNGTIGIQQILDISLFSPLFEYNIKE